MTSSGGEEEGKVPLDRFCRTWATSYCVTVCYIGPCQSYKRAPSPPINRGPTRQQQTANPSPSPPVRRGYYEPAARREIRVLAGGVGAARLATPTGYSGWVASLALRRSAIRKVPSRNPETQRLFMDYSPSLRAGDGQATSWRLVKVDSNLSQD